ncbi:MAG: hypothetical protein GXO09_04040 [Crenarchaeota archaeon]|nr:hypothetical protein [Thermoproteota archaeon]
MNKAAVIAVIVIVAAVAASAALLLHHPRQHAAPRRTTPLIYPPGIPAGVIAGARPGVSVSVEGLKTGGEIPRVYTCDSRAYKPPTITWRLEGSAKIESWLIVVDDPDAPGGVFYHLLVYNIPPDTRHWPGPGELGLNTARRPGWFPVCPPPGSPPHHYYFIVIGLDKKLDVPRGASPYQVFRAAEGHAVVFGYTYGVYKR